MATSKQSKNHPKDGELLGSENESVQEIRDGFQKDNVREEAPESTSEKIVASKEIGQPELLKNLIELHKEFDSFLESDDTLTNKYQFLLAYTRTLVTTTSAYLKFWEESI